MKNIWILNHYAITPEMTGSTRHYDFVIELIKRGYAVTIFSSSFRHQGKRRESKLKENEKWKIENIDGINFIWIKTFHYQKNDWRRVINMLSYMWRAYWLGKKVIKINSEIKKPDTILGSSPHLLAVLSAYWLSKFYKSKFIMEVRDLWPQTLIDIEKFKKNNFIIKTLQILEKFLYKKATKIIVLLPKADKYITSLSINQNKIIWIPNGVDLTKFKETGKKDSNRYFKIIYLGAHGIANALESILHTAKIIKEKGYDNIKFVFIGDGPKKKNLIEYKTKLGLQNTEFCESVAKKEVPAVLNQADIFVVHFKKSNVHKYGISFNKLFDYMATGRPIIFAVSTPISPVNKVRCGFSINPENPEDMARTIIKLYQMSPEQREKMGQRGRKYVEKYNNIPVLVDKLEKIFQEVNNS